MLGEDVEDQRGAVDDLDLELVLQLAQLAGRELAVADHGVGAGGVHGVAQLVDLAGADEGGRVGRGCGAGPGRRAPAEPAVSASRASSASEASACSALPSVQTPTSTTRSRRSCRYSTSVTSVSSVERPGDAAQRAALLELELAARRTGGWSAGSTGDGAEFSHRGSHAPTSNARGVVARFRLRRARPRASHQPASSSPEATSTAGPCSTVVVVGDGDAQPAAGRVHRRPSPVVPTRGAQRGDDRGDGAGAAGAGLAHAALVHPHADPRRRATGVTNSTFTPCGNSGGVVAGRPRSGRARPARRR